MMRWISSRLVWGALLVLGGIALLLQNLDILPSIGDLFWALLFTLGGAAFLSIYFENRMNWWAFIPAFTLFGLSGSAVLSAISSGASNFFGGLVFFLCISLGFIFAYLVDRQQWWAIIPAGVLLTLGVVSVIDNSSLDIDSGAVFFLGVGITFAFLAILPGYEKILRWAMIPSGIMILIGLLVAAASSNMVNLIFPAALILVGLFLVLRTIYEKGQ